MAFSLSLIYSVFLYTTIAKSRRCSSENIGLLEKLIGACRKFGGGPESSSEGFESFIRVFGNLIGVIRKLGCQPRKLSGPSISINSKSQPDHANRKKLTNTNICSHWVRRLPPISHCTCQYSQYSEKQNTKPFDLRKRIGPSQYGADCCSGKINGAAELFQSKSGPGHAKGQSDHSDQKSGPDRKNLTGWSRRLGGRSRKLIREVGRAESGPDHLKSGHDHSKCLPDHAKDYPTIPIMKADHADLINQISQFAGG